MHNTYLYVSPISDASATANFANEACTAGGVKATDSLLFTCEINGIFILRIVLPTGGQELISVGDTTADVVLPSGFTAVSLNITEIDEFRRNFILMISIDRASHLNGGEIKCDDTTPRNEARAGCLIDSESSSKCFIIAVTIHVVLLGKIDINRLQQIYCKGRTQ